MKRLIDFLAPLGLLVILGTQAWSMSGRALPGEERYYLIGGLFLIVLHLVMRFEALVAFVGRRQLRYGGNAFLFVLGVLAILVALNWIAFRNPKRWDLTKNQRYSLSEQTKKILASLKDDVTITYFQRTTAMGGAADRLQDFQTASKRIKTSFVDPLQSPAKAREYEAKGPWPVVVVEKGSARERITSDGEQDITNAIIKVTRDKKKTVCFVEGEGERDIEQSGDQGYTNARAALGRSQYETKKVLLLREKNVPPECTVVAVTGPEKDLLPPVVDALRAFVQGGGKALVLLEPETKESYPNLAGLLKEWNVEAGKDVVVDVSGIGQLFGTSELTPIVAKYPPHDITRDFRVMTAFHTARSMAAGKESKPSLTAQDLLQTSERSWAESDLSLKGEIRMDEAKDKIGPVTLGAAVTLRDTTPPSPAPSAPAASPSPGASPSPAAEEPKEKKEGRVVAIGDADFASNALLGFQGNQDFFLNTVAWLAQDADLISIRPREPEDQRLFLTRTQQRLVSLLALAFLPGAFVLLGIANWWRRR
jgi:gliding motility-associatede transport system auxiliary component